MMQRYLDMPNTDHWSRVIKWQGLKACGLRDKEADRLCEPKVLDKEQVLKEVGQMSLAAQKELRKENRRTPKEAPVPIFDWTGHRVRKGEIVFLDNPNLKD